MGIAPDGRLFLLQASGAVSRFAPDMRLIDTSGPLFEGRDPGRGHMAIGEHFLVLSSEALTRTLVLERESFAPVWQIPKGGPVALDGRRRLFILSEDAVWAYDLANAAALPTPVTEWPLAEFTPRPQAITLDPVGRQLLVTMAAAGGSHPQQWLAGYDLDTLGPPVVFPGVGGQMTNVSAGGQWIVAEMSASTGFLGSRLAVFDREGHEVRSAQPFDGRPVIDAAGEWIYVLRERGLWVLRASDLALVAMEPNAANPDQDLLLSPDGARLYLVDDGSTGTKDTARLRSAGIAPLRGPLLPNWFDPARHGLFPGALSIPSRAHPIRRSCK